MGKMIGKNGKKEQHRSNAKIQRSRLTRELEKQVETLCSHLKKLKVLQIKEHPEKLLEALALMMQVTEGTAGTLGDLHGRYRCLAASQKKAASCTCTKHV